jgi:hypothetical protein
MIEYILAAAYAAYCCTFCSMLGYTLFNERNEVEYQPIPEIVIRSIPFPILDTIIEL